MPVDCLMRCREVSTDWRSYLDSERALMDLWTRLDLSNTSGVERRSPALLRVFCGRAGGRLRSLDVSGWTDDDTVPEEDRLPQLLVEIARANPSLRTLKASDYSVASPLPLADTKAGFSVPQIEAVLSSAPSLSHDAGNGFQVDALERMGLKLMPSVARRMKMRQPPYEGLTIRIALPLPTVDELPQIILEKLGEELGRIEPLPDEADEELTAFIRGTITEEIASFLPFMMAGIPDIGGYQAVIHRLMAKIMERVVEIAAEE